MIVSNVTNRMPMQTPTQTHTYIFNNSSIVLFTLLTYIVYYTPIKKKKKIFVFSWGKRRNSKKIERF